MKGKAIVLTTALIIGHSSFAENTPTLANWQQQRSEGLKHLEKITPDLMSVNARKISPLNERYSKELSSLNQIKQLVEEPDIESIVVLRGREIVFEYYDDDVTATSSHSAQSSTKPMSALLLAKALPTGKISADDKIEKVIPEIGAGFKGYSIRDIMSMTVPHEFDEAAASTSPDDSRLGQLRIRDETSFGYLPASNDELVSRREFAQGLKSAADKGSDFFRYATINIEVAGWAIERAINKPLALQVRELMHEIGGEHTVYMGTDNLGVPMIGSGLVMTTRDFARYGMLLRDSDYLQSMKKNLTAKEKSEGTYKLSLEFSQYGYGHAGWAGQMIFADPDTGIVMAIFGGIKGPNPVSDVYFDKLYSAAAAAVEFYR